MRKAIYLDMDGTFVDFYSVPNWLDYLRKNDTTPYETAKPLLKMNELARTLNKLQAGGWHIGIVSWCSKTGTKDFNNATTAAKRHWLESHLKSVKWDEIRIVSYGTPKGSVVDFPDGILFDDEKQNRIDWQGEAFDETDLLKVLKGFLK